MAIHISRARFAVVVAVVLALFVSGVVAGAAGSSLIIGAANQAGTSNTSLNTTSSGFAWQMNQLGSGVGVFAISQDGNALAALAHNGNKYGLSATNDGAAGTGAAVIADGRNNVGVEIRTNSTSVPPLKVNSTGLVTNLNADLLDGMDSTELMAAGAPQGKAVVTNVSLDPPDGGTQKVEIIAPETGKVFHGHITGDLAGPAGTTGGFTCVTVTGFGIEISTSGTFGQPLRSSNADFVCTELYVTATDTNDAVDAGATTIRTATVYFETTDVTTLP